MDTSTPGDERPNIVLEYLASLPRSREQAKRTLKYWSHWLEQRLLGGINSPHNFTVWQQFFVDHTAIYSIGDRGDYGLPEWIDLPLCENKLKRPGPLSFQEVKQLIRGLIRWQAYRQWNSPEDLQALTRLYQRFGASLRNPARLLTGLPDSAINISKMVSAGIWLSTGERDTALIALSRSLCCTPEELAQMKCSDVETDDWQHWSVRMPERNSAMRIYLDPNTAFHLICWLYTRAWRPSLKAPLFTVDYQYEPLTACQVQQIFERRYRLSQVVLHPSSPCARDYQKLDTLFADDHEDAACKYYLEMVTDELINAIKSALKAECLFEGGIARERALQGESTEESCAPSPLIDRERIRRLESKAVAEWYVRPPRPIFDSRISVNSFISPTLSAETDDDQPVDWDVAVRKLAERNKRAEPEGGAVGQLDWDVAILKTK
ncbi:hypothetical protein ACIUV2_25345 [Pseudomonas aeruginosa]|nr:hypothetical protein [Pseudomonas aeruginosa]